MTIVNDGDTVDILPHELIKIGFENVPETMNIIEISNHNLLILSSPHGITQVDGVTGVKKIVFTFLLRPDNTDMEDIIVKFTTHNPSVINTNETVSITFNILG